MNRLAVLLAHERDAVEGQLLQIQLRIFDILLADGLEPAHALLAFAFRHHAPDAIVFLYKLAFQHHEALRACAVDTAVQNAPAFHGPWTKPHNGRLVGAVHRGPRGESQGILACAGVDIK